VALFSTPISADAKVGNRLHRGWLGTTVYEQLRKGSYNMVLNKARTI
jgi:hypothetical protein